MNAPAWKALYRRAFNVAASLSNYVEDRPGLRQAEREMEDIEREAAMLAAAPEPPADLLDDSSLRAKIGDAGNQVHNLSCEHGNDEKLSQRLGEIASSLWTLARQASPEPQPDPRDAEIRRLRMVLVDLLSWFPEKPSTPVWRLPVAASDAVEAARSAIALPEMQR